MDHTFAYFVLTHICATACDHIGNTATNLQCEEEGEHIVRVMEVGMHEVKKWFKCLHRNLGMNITPGYLLVNHLS